MYNLHRNLFTSGGNGYGSILDSSRLSSALSDSGYTSVSELSLETLPAYTEYLVPSEPELEDALDITSNVTKLDVYPFDCGNSADIYRGELALASSNISIMVAIKIFRRIHTNRDELQRTTQRLYKEAKIWSTLNHVNILQCLGISRDVGPSPALISPLCSHGPVTKYLQKFTKTEDEKLQIIIGVARGLGYLHSQDIVHGSLSTTKILINADEIPVICGYGMSKVLGTPEDTTPTIPPLVRFTPPEYFTANSEEVGNRTTAGDVYSFTMVVLEILSGARPYHEFPTDNAVLFHAVRGGRPDRGKLLKRIPDAIWNLLTCAWNQRPSLRPDMDAVLQYLQSLEISQGDQGYNFLSQSLAEENEEPQVYSSSGEETSFEDDSFQEISGLDLQGRVVQDDQFPFACGGNSNVYRGKISRNNKKSIRVVIKVIRISDDGTGQLEDALRRLKREASIWCHLKHKNLLPFIGVCHDIAPWPVLVSPFYKYGHLHKYLSNFPGANRSQLILGVAAGLEYLHSQNVVHGDLKAANVIIDKRGNPCISDFGISKVLGYRGFTTASVGTPPYMAPELFFVLDAKLPFSPETTKKTDVYSFGLLVLEILTRAPPRRRPMRPIINAKDYANLHPRRSDYLLTVVSDEMWNVILTCWARFPSVRPSMKELKSRLSQICHEETGSYGPVNSASGMEGKFKMRLKNSVEDVIRAQDTSADSRPDTPTPDKLHAELNTTPLLDGNQSSLVEPDNESVASSSLDVHAKPASFPSSLPTDHENDNDEASILNQPKEFDPIERKQGEKELSARRSRMISRQQTRRVVKLGGPRDINGGPSHPSATLGNHDREGQQTARNLQEDILTARRSRMRMRQQARGANTPEVPVAPQGIGGDNPSNPSETASNHDIQTYTRSTPDPYQMSRTLRLEVTERPETRTRDISVDPNIKQEREQLGDDSPQPQWSNPERINVYRSLAMPTNDPIQSTLLTESPIPQTVASASMISFAASIRGLPRPPTLHKKHLANPRPRDSEPENGRTVRVYSRCESKTDLECTVCDGGFEGPASFDSKKHACGEEDDEIRHGEEYDGDVSDSAV